MRSSSHITMLRLSLLLYRAILIAATLVVAGVFAQSAHAQSSFEQLTCDVAEGWACLPAGSTIEFYDGDNITGTLLGSTSLTVTRTDITGASVCPAGINDPVGFTYLIPASVKDGVSHDIHAYGVNASDGTVSELSQSSRSITCSTPDLEIRNPGAVPQYGGDYELRAEIINNSPVPTPGDFTLLLEFDYDDDGSIDIVRTQTVPAIGAGASINVSETVQLTTYGNHSFVMTANPSFADFSETNNSNNATPKHFVNYNDGVVAVDPSEPPEIVLFGARVAGSGDAWEHHSISVTEGEVIELAWAANNATYCESDDTREFETGGAVSGITTHKDPYRDFDGMLNLTCTGPGGTATAQERYAIRPTNPVEVTSGIRVLGSGRPFLRELVIVEGDRMELSWNSNITDPQDLCYPNGSLKSDDYRGSESFGISSSAYRIFGYSGDRSHWRLPPSGQLEMWHIPGVQGPDGSPPSVGGPSHAVGLSCRRYITDTTFDVGGSGSMHYYVLPADAPAPTVEFTHKTRSETLWSEAASRNIEAGEDLELRWVSQNAVECIGTGPGFDTNWAWRGVDTDVTEPAVGATETYSVTCTGPGGSVTSEVTIEAADNLGAPPIVDVNGYSADSLSSWHNNTIHVFDFDWTTPPRIEWVSSNADTCVAEGTAGFTTAGNVDGIAPVVPATNDGEVVVGRVRCTNEHGSTVSDDITFATELGAGIAPQISVRVDGAGPWVKSNVSIHDGQTVELRWSSDNDSPDPANDLCWVAHQLRETVDAGGPGVDRYDRNNPTWSTTDAGGFAANLGYTSVPAMDSFLPYEGTFDSTTLNYNQDTSMQLPTGGSSRYYQVSCARFDGSGLSSDYAWSGITITSVPDTGAPPTAELSVQPVDSGGNPGSWTTGDIIVEETDTLNFQWDSQDATSCSSPDFDTNNQPDGFALGVMPPPLGGVETYSVTCTGPNGTATDEITVTTGDVGGPNLPDLVPGNPDLDTSFSNPDPVNRQWDNVALRAVFENDGTLDLTSADVSYRFDIDYGDDGTYDVTDITNDWSGTLAVGDTTGVQIVSADNIEPGTTHRLRLRIDRDPARVTEINENNNERSVLVEVPVPNPDMSLTPDRELIPPGETVELTWEVNANYAMSCDLIGPGFDSSDSFTTPPANTGSKESAPLQSSTEFVLECTDGISGDSYTESVTVNVTTAFEEI